MYAEFDHLKYNGKRINEYDIICIDGSILILKRTRKYFLTFIIGFIISYGFIIVGAIKGDFSKLNINYMLNNNQVLIPILLLILVIAPFVLWSLVNLIWGFSYTFNKNFDKFLKDDKEICSLSAIKRIGIQHLGGDGPHNRLMLIFDNNGKIGRKVIDASDDYEHLSELGKLIADFLNINLEKNLKYI